MNKKNPGIFLDVGCFRPILINNTYLLELHGWDGISVDMKDVSSEWYDKRKTKFVMSDAFSVDYSSLLNSEFGTNLIDYLSVDLEIVGDRVKILKKILDSGIEAKIITIEHDGYLGDEFVNLEKNPQREYLKEKGYVLLCSDISNLEGGIFPFEDWWINPNYFEKEEYEKWMFDNQKIDTILKKLDISYTWNKSE
jgi:hypothetical protein